MPRLNRRVTVDGDSAKESAVLQRRCSGLPDPNAMAPLLFVPTLSTGKSAWFPVDLSPGYYALICFIPDIESGVPHAMKGMYDVIEVGEEATPSA
jgi:hypothetical protein